MAYEIEIAFKGGLSASQKKVFELAAKRWSELITSVLPAVSLNGKTIKGLLIEAKGISINQAGGVLGQAGPTHLRPVSMLPARGIMEFDSADLASMEQDGSLQSVITHEMGHVIGIGTIWHADNLNLVKGSETSNPTFVGPEAMKEFGKLIGKPSAPVPLENTGGPGTAEGHWREKIFGDEMMTGFLSGPTQPFSRLTLAALVDLGYKVDMSKADPFVLPSHLELAMMGVGAENSLIRRCQMCSGAAHIPDRTVLAADAVLETTGKK